MPGRYWLPILAVVGLTLATPQPSRAQGNQIDTIKARSIPRTTLAPTLPPELQDSLNRIGTALEVANGKKPPLDETERAKEDLAAQLVMARSADRMFYVGLAETVITFLGVMLVLATLIYTKKASEAARDAVTKANETMEQAERHAQQELRAYVGVAKRECLAPENSLATIQITVKNSGSTPAYRLHHALIAWVDSFPTPSAEPKIRPHRNTRGKMTLGPIDETRRRFRVRTSTAEVTAIEQRQKAIWCRGVIHYRDAFGKKRKASYRYYLNGPDFADEMSERRMFVAPNDNYSD